MRQIKSLPDFRPTPFDPRRRQRGGSRFWAFVLLVVAVFLYWGPGA